MRNEKAMVSEGMWYGRNRADQTNLLGKYKKMKPGHMLEKKCREAHPSKRNMDIPSNPAPKKLLSVGVYIS